MTNYVVYHTYQDKITGELTDCPDGIISAAIAYAGLNYDATLLGDYYRHGSDYPEIPEQEKYPFKPGDTVVIVDFSYPFHWLKYWESKDIELTIIDHHADKFPQLEGFSRAILDEKECGATLTFKHFFPNKILPEILKDVRRRDIGADGYYRGLVPDSEAFNEALNLWRISFLDKYQLVKELSDLITVCHSSYKALAEDILYRTFLPIGRLKLQERNEAVAKICKRAELRELKADKNYTVPYIQLDKEESRFVSTIGHKLAKEHPDCPFAWIETPTGHSLRSIDFDVRPVAKHFSGEGIPKLLVLLD